MTTKKQAKLPIGARIIRGLSEFRDTVLEGKLPAGDDKFTVRTVELDLEPSKYSPQDVQATREALSVSQAVLAQLLGTSVQTVQSWEQGVREPSRMARRFMDEIRANPEHWIARLNQAVTYKRRKRGELAAR